MDNAPPHRGPDENDDGLARTAMLERTVHDLKNPLAVVRSALEFLELEVEGRADAVDAVRDATTAAARLLSIVEDLDALAQLERGGVNTDGALDLTSIIGRVTAAAAARVSRNGLSVTSTVPATLSTRGDAALLSRALDALVDACARGAPAGTCIELVARFAGDEQDLTACIEIEIGQQGTVAVAAETQALDALGTGGLGPYLALEVAKAHGGSVAVLATATMPRAVLRLPR